MENTRENTPKHCWDCAQFKDCHQAQSMVAGTEAVKGFVVSEIADGTYIGEHFCADCLTEAWEDDAIPMDYEECDGPYHCCKCGVPLLHGLTSEGIDYMREAVEEGGGCAREVWPTVWADCLEE